MSTTTAKPAILLVSQDIYSSNNIKPTSKCHYLLKLQELPKDPAEEQHGLSSMLLVFIHRNKCPAVEACMKAHLCCFHPRLQQLLFSWSHSLLKIFCQSAKLSLVWFLWSFFTEHSLDSYKLSFFPGVKWDGQSSQWCSQGPSLPHSDTVLHRHTFRMAPTEFSTKAINIQP